MPISLPNDLLYRIQESSIKDAERLALHRNIGAAVGNLIAQGSKEDLQLAMETLGLVVENLDDLAARPTGEKQYELSKEVLAGLRAAVHVVSMQRHDAEDRHLDGLSLSGKRADAAEKPGRG